MLKDSEIYFFNSKEKLAIEFKTKCINNNILESIKKNTDFIIDTEKLLLVNEDNKYLIALLYNVDILDAKVGRLKKKICIVSDNVGFIISPVGEWQRNRIIECYNAIKSGLFKAFFSFDKLDKGLIELVIIYKI